MGGIKILKFLARLLMHVVSSNEIGFVGVKDKINFVHFEIASKRESLWFTEYMNGLLKKNV